MKNQNPKNSTLARAAVTAQLSSTQGSNDNNLESG